MRIKAKYKVCHQGSKKIILIKINMDKENTIIKKVQY
jgi:hypothetical protein